VDLPEVVGLVMAAVVWLVVVGLAGEQQEEAETVRVAVAQLVVDRSGKVGTVVVVEGTLAVAAGLAEAMHSTAARAVAGELP
jgi:uncharacterized membrane protein